MIITPSTAGLAPALPRDIKVWVDAYTMQLEASFAAAMNSEVKGEVADAVKRSAADAKSARDGSAAQFKSAQVAENQRDIQAKVAGFNMDAYHAIRAAWARLSVDLAATGWDLAEDIGFEKLPDGHVRIQQRKESLLVQREVAQLAYAFLLWVEEASEKADPREYVKRMLSEQGIGPDNFDQHAGRLGIANPWATGPLNKVILP